MAPDATNPRVQFPAVARSSSRPYRPQQRAGTYLLAGYAGFYHSTHPSAPRKTKVYGVIDQLARYERMKYKNNLAAVIYSTVLLPTTARRQCHAEGPGQAPHGQYLSVIVSILA